VGAVERSPLLPLPPGKLDPARSAGVIRTESSILGTAGAPDRQTLLARLDRLVR
jgi:hypothetical protein